MKVLVTGASGKLGSETVQQLHATGHEIIATDAWVHNPLPVPLHEMNLLNTAAVAALMPGAEAVIHLANHVHVQKGIREAEIFNENVAMNMNVFQAAVDSGVKRVIFASTIQVMASESGGNAPYPEYANRVACLPLSRNSPKNPGNSYSLSKSVAETMMEQYLVPRGITCIALRFPRIVREENLAKYSESPLGKDVGASHITQCFGVISRFDAATATVACLTAPLTGFHTFLPSVSQVKRELVKPAIERWYADVPLSRPIEQIDSLVDHSHLTQATGWRPHDLV
jgi:nucleoside-diphosphate-sugar epimerase